MKKVVVLISMLYVANVFAQVDINEFSMMDIHAQTQDWWPALRVNVPTTNSCAFNLRNEEYGADVSFFNASGYLWCLRGGYFGSDSSLKRNIATIDSSLNKVVNLRGVRYQYKPFSAEEERLYDSLPGLGYRYGFIAQEVENVLPEVVKDMPDGTKAITYTDLIAVLVEAIKQQQAQINQQQTEIDELRQALIDNHLINE